MESDIHSKSRKFSGRLGKGVRRTRRGRPSLAELASRQESTHERLLTSAIDAFAKHGFDAVTTGLICFIAFGLGILSRPFASSLFLQRAAQAFRLLEQARREVVAALIG